MALSVNGENSLYWEAQLGTDQFLASQNKLDNAVQEGAKKAVEANKQFEASIRGIIETNLQLTTSLNSNSTSANPGLATTAKSFDEIKNKIFEAADAFDNKWNTVLRQSISEANASAESINRLQNRVSSFGGGVLKQSQVAADAFKNIRTQIVLAETSAEQAANSLGSKLPAGTNQASQSLINLGRVAQDAPFGFIGIQNNIPPLLESFQRLRDQTGSTKGALQLLSSSMLGVGGLGFAVSVVTSLLTVASMNGLLNFGKNSEEAAKKTKELASDIAYLNKAANEYNQAQKKGNDQAAEQLKTVAHLVASAESEIATDKQKAQALKELQSISSEYFGGLKIEDGLIKGLTQSYQKYADNIIQVAKAKGNANFVENLTKQLVGVSDMLSNVDTQLTTLSKKNQIIGGPLVVGEKIKEIQSLLDKGFIVTKDIQRISELTGISENKVNDAVSRRAALKSKELSLSAQILDLSKKSILSETDVKIITPKEKEDGSNALLEKKKTLLEEIADLQRGASQSGLIKEQSELDKVNEKYDKFLRKIQDYNNEVTKFNNKNPSAHLALITGSEIDTVNQARALEIANTQAKQEAAIYIASLEDKKKAFDDFQKFQTEGDSKVTEKAKELYKDQIGDYTSYLDFLKKEKDRLTTTVSTTGGNVGVLTELEAVNKKIVAENNKSADLLIVNQIADYKHLLEGTKGYYEQRRVIEEKYQKGVAVVNKNVTGEEQQTFLRLLSEQRDKDLTNLQDNVAHQSQLYQKLNQDQIRFTRDQLKQRLELLKQYLKDGFILESDGTKTTITPQMKADLQNGIKQAKDFLNSTNTVLGVPVDKLKKIAEAAQSVGSSLKALGSSVSPLNEQLGEAISQMGDVAGIGSDVVSSFASFATGDILGGISSAVGALSGIFGLFAKAKEEEAKQKKAIDDFNVNLVEGEVAINEQYRERAVIQSQINKLKLDGLKAEADALAGNKTQAVSDYKTIFDALQKETFKSLQTVKELQPGTLSSTAINQLLGQGLSMAQIIAKYGTDVQKIIDAPLAGKSFDDLNKLFLSGQLDGKAKELFQTLEKLKQDGVDIDAALAENKKNAQEVFTGTTASNITDMIVQGFRDGKRAVVDFADSTEDLIRGAMLNALKYQSLEGPINKLFDQFAIDAESNGGLDLSEINNFNSGIANAIKNATLMAQQLEKASGISLSATNSATGANSLQGGFKALTETTGELLAGQFGGLRLTAFDQLNVAQSQLRIQNKIEANTAAAVIELANHSSYFRKWDANGLHVW